MCCEIAEGPTPSYIKWNIHSGSLHAHVLNLTIEFKIITSSYLTVVSFMQNNVLELWSLFDFLMPGFLGTKRQVCFSLQLVIKSIVSVFY